MQIMQMYLLVPFGRYLQCCAPALLAGLLFTLLI